MNNPFKPGSGLYPPYFAGRKREIDIFADKLEQTMDGSPMHMSIIGDWATGKTSLMERFKEVAEKKGCFVAEVTSPVTDSSAIFVNTVSNSIAYEVRRRDGLKVYSKIKEKVDTIGGIGITAFGFGATVQRAKAEKSTPQFDLRVGLKAVWETLSSRYKALVLLVDDFDLISEDKKTWKEIMITFRNGLMEAIRDDVKVICVVNGTRLFEQFESIHGPLVRFFEPFELGNLNEKEAEMAVLEPLKGSRVVFSDDVVKKVIQTTDGHPYYLQEFCYVLYKKSKNGKVDMNVFESTYEQIMHDLARKMWQQKIAEIGEVSTTLLYLIAKGNTTTDSITKRGKKEFEMKPVNMRVVLSRMQQKGLIRRQIKGEYSLNDKLFGEYLIGLCSQNEETMDLK